MVIEARVPAEWIRNEADREAERRGAYFDAAAARFVCDFFETFLVLSGRPFRLELWERDYLSRLFGWKLRDGRRRFKESYVEIPKKNGKSTLFSGLCLYGLIDEPGAGVYQGAVDREQAKIVFRAAAAMVKASPALRGRFHVQNYNSTILWGEGNARMACMSADVPSKDGLDSSLTVIDEVHRLTGNRRLLYDVMKYAGAARRNPLLVGITTAGVDRNSLCWELHEEARRIDDGATDNLRFLGVIYAAGPDDDLDDPATWHKANPSLGSILSEEDFADEWAEAKRIPGRLNNFKRLRFNIWTNAVAQWLPLDLWDACSNTAEMVKVGDRYVFDHRWWAGRTVNLGVDLSSVRDLTAIVMTTLDDKVVQWHSTYFLPGRTMQERADRDGVPYPEWVAQGWIVETDGDATDFAAIRAWINRLRDDLGIVVAAIGMDPWNAAQLAIELGQDGFNVAFVRQTMGNLTGPSKELERRLTTGELAHDGSPVTRWCVGNCSTVSDGQGNIMPSKTKSTEKIDGVAAGVMSLGMTVGRELPPEPRVSAL